MTKCLLRKPNELMLLYAGQASIYIIEFYILFYQRKMCRAVSFITRGTVKGDNKPSFV